MTENSGVGGHNTPSQKLNIEPLSVDTLIPLQGTKCILLIQDAWFTDKPRFHITITILLADAVMPAKHDQRFLNRPHAHDNVAEYWSKRGTSLNLIRSSACPHSLYLPMLPCPPPCPESPLAQNPSFPVYNTSNRCKPTSPMISPHVWKNNLETSRWKNPEIPHDPFFSQNNYCFPIP